MARGLGEVQKKILILLWGGLALSFSRSPYQYRKILKAIGREWQDINRRSLVKAIGGLYKSKLISSVDNKDGSSTIVLSEDGKNRVFSFQLDNLAIKKPKNWDQKWRVVIFDIPEDLKKVRDSLRYQLKKAGLRELQKSVFIHPFPCQDEIEFLIEFYQVRPHVRQLTVEWIDNELHLRKNFGLL